MAEFPVQLDCAGPNYTGTASKGFAQLGSRRAWVCLGLGLLAASVLAASVLVLEDISRATLPGTGQLSNNRSLHGNAEEPLVVNMKWSECEEASDTDGWFFSLGMQILGLNREAHETVRCQDLSGVGRLSNFQMDYDTRTSQNSEVTTHQLSAVKYTCHHFRKTWSTSSGGSKTAGKFPPPVPFVFDLSNGRTLSKWSGEFGGADMCPVKWWLPTLEDSDDIL